MEKAIDVQNPKLKGYLLGLTFTSLAGIILGWSGPLLEMAGLATSLFTSPFLYIAIVLQLVGGLFNFFALSYLRPAIVFPVYGSIQIFESVIVAQILLPATNPWHNLFIASLILIVVSLTLMAYSISKKPEEEVVDLLPPAPTLQVEATIDAGVAEVFKLLDINLMGAYGRIRHRWAHSGRKYTHPLIIESCFSSLVWKIWLPDIATEILEPFFDAQTADGRFPSKLKMFGKQYREVYPLMAYCIAAINHPSEFLEQVYLKLIAFQQWLYQNRMNSEGLFYWNTPEESGMPEAPRFEDLTESSHIIPVDLNALIVLQNISLAQIAANLGLSEEAKKHEAQASELTEKVQAKLWDAKSKMFYDWDSKKNEFIQTMVLTNFIPMIAQIPTDEQANSLISHLTNGEKFNTSIPFPSVSVSDDKFAPSKWQGAVSVSLAYLILQGLQQYQKEELATELALKLVQGVLSEWETGGAFNEFYSPDSSKHPLEMKPGKDYVGSTGLINKLLVEGILGLNLQNSEMILHPRFPNAWKNQKITYSIPTRNLILKMEFKETDEIKVELTLETRKEKFVMKNYEEKRIKL